MKKITMLFVFGLLFVSLSQVSIAQDNNQGIRNILCERDGNGGWHKCSIDQEHIVNMHGTEYHNTQDVGKIWLQLVKDEVTIENASCALTMYDPDASYFIEEAPMMEVEEGIYHYDFPIDRSMNGVYMSRAECEYESNNSEFVANNFTSVTATSKYGEYQSTYEQDGVYQTIDADRIGSSTGNVFSVVSDPHSLEYDEHNDIYTIFRRNSLHHYNTDFEYLGEVDIDLPSQQMRGHDYNNSNLFSVDRDGIVWVYDENYTQIDSYDLSNEHDIGLIRDLEYLYGNFYTIDSELQVVRKYDENFTLLETWDVSYAEDPVALGDVETTDCTELCSWVVDESDGTIYRNDLDDLNVYNETYDVSDLDDTPTDLLWDKNVDYFYLLGYQTDSTYELGHGCSRHNCVYYSFNLTDILNQEYLDIYWQGDVNEVSFVMSLWNFEKGEWEELPNEGKGTDHDFMISNRVYNYSKFIEDGEMRIGYKTRGDKLHVSTDYLSVVGRKLVEDPTIELKGSSEAHIKEPLGETANEEVADQVWSEFRRLRELDLLQYETWFEEKTIKVHDSIVIGLLLVLIGLVIFR